MNRNEVLLEALKETDKLLVSLVESRSQASIAPANEAAERIEEITAAILEDDVSEANDINTALIECREVCQWLQIENQRLLEESRANRDCNSRLNDAIEANRILKQQATNPALENVLAALRMIVRFHDEHKSLDSSMIYGVDGSCYCASLTLGDLRRWVESEKGQS